MRRKLSAAFYDWFFMGTGAAGCAGVPLIVLTRLYYRPEWTEHQAMAALWPCYAMCFLFILFSRLWLIR